MGRQSWRILLRMDTRGNVSHEVPVKIDRQTRLKTGAIGWAAMR
jgi:hypothetical protein